MFYIGSWLILQDSIDLKHDSDSWELPELDTNVQAGHLSNTSNPSEMLVVPEKIDLVPEQIQFGIAEWTAEDESTLDHEAYKEFYVSTTPAWYTRSFTGVDFFYPFTEPS